MSKIVLLTVLVLLVLGLIAADVSAEGSGVIEGTVFYDNNKSGQRDGGSWDRSLYGWTVKLYEVVESDENSNNEGINGEEGDEEENGDSNENGENDNNDENGEIEIEIGTAVTSGRFDDEHMYTFENLEEGTYRVRVNLPGIWEQTYPQDEYHEIEITNNETVRADFGLFVWEMGEDFISHKYIKDAPNERQSLEFWVNNVFGQYWPSAYAENFIENAVLETVRLEDFYGTGIEVAPGREEMRFADGSVVWWSWWLTYYNHTAMGNEYNGGPDNRGGKYWSHAEWAMAVPGQPTAYWFIPGDNDLQIVIGAYCGNITRYIDTPLYLVEGYKWHDLNGDGIWDDDEPTLSGWTISLHYADTGEQVYDAFGRPYKTETDANGYFMFDLRFYDSNFAEDIELIVKEKLKDGWKNTYSPPSFVVTQAGGIFDENNFGNFELGIKEGMKFEDMKKTGAYDSDNDRPLPDWTIELYQVDRETGDEKPDPIATTKTDAEGNYRFENLGIGTYRVREKLKDGWEQTYPASGYHEFTINRSGQVHSNNDFGNFELGIKEGMKFDDRRGNGLYKPEEGDAPLSGWEMILYRVEEDGTKTPYKHTVTDENGRYRFDNLDLGTYCVEEDLKDGWIQTCPATEVTEEKPVEGKEPGTLIPGCRPFKITHSGFKKLDNDFGNWRISGYLGRTPGYWYQVYRRSHNPEADMYIDYINREGYLEIINQQSRLFGEEGKYFGFLTVETAESILHGNSHIPYQDDKLLKEMAKLRRHLLATLLNIVSVYDFFDPDFLIYLHRLDSKYQDLFGEVIKLSDLINLIEEDVIKTYKCIENGGDGDCWDSEKIEMAKDILDYINNAEKYDGAPFRPALECKALQ